MMKPILMVDFSDLTESVPSFVTIIAMPFTASISEGIVLGMLSYVTVKVLTGRFRELSPVMYILAVLFVLKYII